MNRINGEHLTITSEMRDTFIDGIALTNQMPNGIILEILKVNEEDNTIWRLENEDGKLLVFPYLGCIGIKGGKEMCKFDAKLTMAAYLPVLLPGAKYNLRVLNWGVYGNLLMSVKVSGNTEKRPKGLEWNRLSI